MSRRPQSAGTPRSRGVMGRGAMRRGRLLLSGAAVAVVIVLAATFLFARQTPTAAQGCAARGAPTGLGAGQCAPNFTLSDVQGHRVSLSDFRGKPVLLHFWAVACTTCAAEYPDFSRAVRQYEPKGLSVVALDAWGEQPGLVRGWQSTHHLPATYLIDEPQAVVARYAVQGTPTTFFIDRGGRIAYTSPGPLSYGDYARHITSILS